MDTLSHHHSTSIFKKHTTGFFSDAATTSWKNKYIDGDPAKGRKKLFGNINFPVQFTDCWHFCKSLMIILILGAIVLYNPLINLWVDFILIGTLWNLIFGLFYNYLLKQKSPQKF